MGAIALPLMAAQAHSLLAQSLPEPEADRVFTHRSTLEKITFDLASIASNGLVGESGAERSLTYEFCIPETDEALAEVLSIDPMLFYYQHSRGRIGCTADQYLIIGSTHGDHWYDILVSLSRLDYVARIDQWLGE